MDFYSFRDEYSAAKKQNLLREVWQGHTGLDGCPSPVEFYEGIKKQVLSPVNIRSLGDQAITQYVLLDANKNWYMQGKPYVKVWPSIASKLSHTSLDIAGKYLKIPYGAFEIRLPRENNPFSGMSDVPELHSIFVIHCEGTYNLRGAESRQLSVWFDLGHSDHISNVGESGFDQPTYGYLHFRIDEEITISETLELSEEINYAMESHSAAGYRPTKEYYKAVLSLAICTCFFMTNSHDLICPDIPLRYQERYKKATELNDKKAVEEIIKKSKKIGMGGHTLGREIELPRPIRINSNEPTQSGQTWQQRFSYVRSGHLRLQAHGPQLSQRKVIFIEPTVVKPLLPPKPSVGYAIKDNILGVTNA